MSGEVEATLGKAKAILGLVKGLLFIRSLKNRGFARGNCGAGTLALFLLKFVNFFILCALDWLLAFVFVWCLLFF